MKLVRNADTLAIVLAICCIGTVASPARAADWEWTLTPYLWATDYGVDVSIKDEPAFGTDIAFSDLFDKLEFAFPIHFEGQRGKSGIFLDLMYIKLDESQTTAWHPHLPDGSNVQAGVKQTLFEAGGFYRPSGGANGLDILYGVRVIDFKMDIDITAPSPSTTTARASSSDTFTDGFLGLRYNAPLGERLSIAVRGDAGTGGTELTWNASALLGYSVGKQRQNLILIGYRHMEVELKDAHNGLKTKTDVTMSGPITGFMFRF